MRSNEKVTATLLVAALVAVGCSKGNKEADMQAQDPPRAFNVSLTDKSGALPGGPGAIPKPAGPASFADGEAAFHAGNYGEATRVFEQYTGEKPENAWGHYMLGLSSWKGGDLAKAASAFDKALEIDPDHLKSLVNSSRVLIEQKDVDEAVVRLTRANQIEPKSAEVQRLMGRAYHAQGMAEESVSAYLRAIALDDQDVWSMNNLGFVYLEQGKPYDALLPLARAVELKKDVATFRNNLGMALEHTGRFTAAAVEYSSALQADPNYEKAKVNLSRVQLVKVNGEEPFDLEATASRFVEQTKVSVAEPVEESVNTDTTAGK